MKKSIIVGICSGVLVGVLLNLNSCSDAPQSVSVIPVPQKMELTGGSISIKDTVGNVKRTIDTVNYPVEGYQLSVTPSRIKITAGSELGLIWAEQTIAQLTDSEGNIAAVEVVDEPRFGYRGVMLDVSRHFQDVEGIKHILDLMQRYKLNRFHWHLTDDQGWRIEIKKYPLLTEKGAWRTFNNQDRQCQEYQAKYDNVDFEIPTKYMKINGTDTLYGGFYTQEEIREVVGYAKERGIEVVPELDMPGHLMAAIIGYPWISCTGVAKWGETFSDPLCVGNDRALQMMKDIYTEVAGLFPYEYMHLGADEVEHHNWKRCPKCQKRIRTEKLKGVEELQSWFVREMEAHFASLGKKFIGWDEIIMGGLSETATVMWWRNWAPEVIPTATAQGNHVIMSPCFQYYFDAWENDGTFRMAYEYEPVDSTLSKEQQANIVGVQGNLWCETVPSMDRIENQYFLRILALAETAWSTKEQRGWEDFTERLTEEVEWLDAQQINYRVPSLTGFLDVNVFIDSIEVVAECLLPNVTVRYTTDGSFPNQESPIYTRPMFVDTTTHFTFRTFRPNGTMGEMFTTTYSKENYSPAQVVDGAKPGISVDRYTFRGNKCTEIKTRGRKIETITMDSLNFRVNSAGVNKWGFAGLVLNGYFEVTEDAIYEFALTSDDGSMLYIDGELLIDHDGPHGATTKRAQRALGKGLHHIEVLYFEGNNSGSLKVEIDGQTLTNLYHR